MILDDIVSNHRDILADRLPLQKTFPRYSKRVSKNEFLKEGMNDTFLLRGASPRRGAGNTSTGLIPAERFGGPARRSARFEFKYFRSGRKEGPA